MSDECPASPTEPATVNGKRKRGRPEEVSLDPFKEQIIKLFSEDDLSIIDIARHLNLENGFDVSERKIARRLTAWNVPKKRARLTASQDMRDRIEFHYNRNLNDDEITAELVKEGYDIQTRTLSRLRQKLGMRRRSKYPEFREYSEEDETPDAQLAAESGQIHLPIPQQSPTKNKVTKGNHNAALIPKVSGYVERYMSKYDGSHDFNHIRRVVGLAHLIYSEINEEVDQGQDEDGTDLDLHVITLAALLHDVGDKKYLEPGQDGNTLVLATLLNFGAPEELAIKVQRIVIGVSYSSEIKDPESVQTLIQKYPELAVVQDADRLDAIGAVGIGRTFTFGGAKGAREMGDTIKHFEEKLERLESMMKTGPGRRLARERTARLTTFKRWWDEEQKEAEGLLKRK